MKLSIIGIGTAGAAALAAGALIMAPTATAVDPTTATLTADCGSFGSGEVKLDATQDGTAATITLSSSAVKAPIAVAENSVETSLTLANANGGDDVTFSGNSNPAMSAGDDVNSGPLDATVTAGDVLEAKSATIKVLGITVNCTATSAQNPGPFTF
ncbi:hypothetical protein DVA86_06145 [Streptomyces armeniacus]|uniref:Uncharacterized protein n=1 Tax=Streptomyces armeniacus TaxID=83291 RepID=A0A345XKX9_9ACTN|nr:hypothetical protein [Streptomyces armeniacus]AXK32295.1 hypothetical protein DVA86_06145 [Streptomyces armeniacus]